MVSKEQKKLNRVLTFIRKGLTGLADELEGTTKSINEFIKSLAKAQKDLKGVGDIEEVKTVSTSSKKIAVAPGQAKAAAAGTLFSLLSGGGAPAAGAPAAAAAPAAGAPAAAAAPAASRVPSRSAGGGPPSRTGAPKAPSSGPPKAPSSGPPKAPTGNVPKRAGLPPAPKLPPTAGGAPKAPAGGVVKTPSFAKRSPTPGGAPPKAPGSAPPKPPGGAAAKAGGGLSSLRDEMLEELTRLKKIMRGD